MKIIPFIIVKLNFKINFKNFENILTKMIFIICI